MKVMQWQKFNYLYDLSLRRAMDAARFFSLVLSTYILVSKVKHTGSCYIPSVRYLASETSLRCLYVYTMNICVRTCPHITLAYAVPVLDI